MSKEEGNEFWELSNSIETTRIRLTKKVALKIVSIAIDNYKRNDLKLDLCMVDIGKDITTNQLKKYFMEDVVDILFKEKKVWVVFNYKYKPAIFFSIEINRVGDVLVRYKLKGSKDHAIQLHAICLKIKEYDNFI